MPPTRIGLTSGGGLPSTPDSRRKRPDTIGGSADVEAPQRMYSFLTPPRGQAQGEGMTLGTHMCAMPGWI